MSDTPRPQLLLVLNRLLNRHQRLAREFDERFPDRAVFASDFEGKQAYLPLPTRLRRMEPIHVKL